MIKVKLVDLLFDEISQMGVILLGEENPQPGTKIKVVPIWIGLFEAQAIMFKLQNLSFPRPLTHDLLKNCIEQLGAKIEYVAITKIENNTYYAEIHLIQNDNKIVVDSRPSDAVALAIRADVPIYMAEELMLNASVDKEEFIKEHKEKLLLKLLELAETEEEKKIKH
jgi:bifunctional DNase/RNase